jgi:hypothetical protein
MAVSYTITWQERDEDGNRGESIHQCPLCGIDYEITVKPPEVLPMTRVWPKVVFSVTDNCQCHNDHEAEEEQALWDAETQTWRG